MPTLVSPDGREYRTSNTVELKRLISGQGYRVKDSEDKQGIELFDPSKHTVKEVQAYLDGNPDDADRVLDAERAGQARTTLLED